tara:strand:- start:1038 stop:2255 length:1218 start_codon:yes stop_codon:yes gene_type:complete
MSIGGSRSKSKTSESGTSEYKPYEPTVEHLDKIMKDMGDWYDDPDNQKFMGGYDYTNYLTPYTAGEKDIIAKGSDAFNYLDPTKFASSDAMLNSYLAGNPTSTGGMALTNLATGKTGTYLDELNAGTNRTAYDGMSANSDEYLSNLTSNVTDRIVNQVSNTMGKMGRYDPNSATFGQNVGQGVANEIADDLFLASENERGREFTSERDNITNLYNAGNVTADNMYRAGRGLSDAEINIAEGDPRRRRDIANNYADMLGTSFGFMGKNREMIDAGKQLEIAKMMFDQGVPMSKMMDYYNVIQGIATGFPTVDSSGTSSSRSGGFGFSANLPFSDNRLKKAIKFLFKLANGINIYSWEWNDKAKELGIPEMYPNYNVGVIAQEVAHLPNAVVQDANGYLKVNYGELV